MKNFSTKYPLVSVVMNCHNGEKYLKESLNSLKDQTYKNWELIFVDNFSEDNSYEIFKQANDKRFNYFRTNRKLKLYHARKIAIKKCRGQYVCFLDTDDLWKKNKLYYQINFLRKKRCEILYSKFDINEISKKKKYINIKKNLPSGFITQSLLNNYTIGILTVFLKTEILKKNNFNEKYTIIGDFDLFIRLSQKYKIYSLNKSLATYRIHQNNLSKKRLDIYVKEMKTWLRLNEKPLVKYDLSKLRFFILKLKIKKFLNFFKNS